MSAPGIRAAVERLRSHAPQREVAIMEFCGGHTVAMFRHGIRSLVPQGVRLLSGPGCPVCVTSDSDLMLAAALASTPGVILATYGDMIRVPGGGGSLADLRSAGAGVEVVYSTLDALDLARAHPDRQVVFFAVGFETSAPAAAMAVLLAGREALPNFSICSVMKLTAPGARALLQSGDVRIDGVLGPGHVSAITGAGAWRFLPDDHGIPVVLSGFEPEGIIASLDALLTMICEGRPDMVNGYRHVVTDQGNLRAQSAVERVFTTEDAEWRGFGVIPASGLRIRPEYANFDALRRFRVERLPARSHPACRCGDVVRALIDPPACPAYGTACTPATPLGPCMVSAEGVCAAWADYA